MVLLILFLLVLSGDTLYHAYSLHETRLLAVSHERIIDSAKQCIWDSKCNENKVTLGELIDKGYCEEEVDPITKLYYSHNCYVVKSNNDYIFQESD